MSRPRTGGRGRRWAMGAAALGLMVIAVAAWASRAWVIEAWWILRLESREPGVKARAIERLGELGSARAARRLIEGVRRAEPGVVDAAAAALGRIYGRVAPPVKAEIADGLLDALAGWLLGELPDPGVEEVLDGIDPRVSQAYPVFLRALGDEAKARAASDLLARAWPYSREALSAHLAGCRPEEIVAFYRSLDSSPLRSRMPEGPVASLARSFALSHPRPEARAVSLAFRVLCGERDDVPRFDMETLREVHGADQHPLVQRAALRIAGCLGDSEGNLDLKALLLGEEDPLLLREAIQARTLWAVTARQDRGLEVADGLLCPWGPGDPEERAWDHDEIARLEELLRRATDPALRDAASLALATRCLDGLRRWDLRPEPLPSLKVHEWGVWKDDEGSLKPPEELLADLPPFVHRSQVTARELWAARSYSPMVVNKPVVFLHAPEPVTLLVQVRFHRGRPWTFYPQATDYLETTRNSPEARPGPFEDGKGLSPPWLLDRPPGDEPAPRPPGEGGEVPMVLPRGELRSRYELVPWLAPNHAPSATADHGGDVELAGIGLEWRGLRVGYGAALEGAMPPAPEGSFWSRLRDVPASPVAVRGNHERFLFYDGAVHLPSPVEAAWADPGRTALSLRIRPFEEFPVDRSLIHERRRTPPTEYFPGILVVRKQAGLSPRGRLLRHLAPGEGPIEVALDSLSLEGPELPETLAAAAEEQGLTRPEARSLAGTWERELFGQDGLRLITFLPGWLYDALLPLEVLPEPGELVRVGLVWKECRELKAAGVPAAPPKREIGARRPFILERMKLSPRTEPLEPGPGEPFSIEPEGRLAGLHVSSQEMLLSGDGRWIAFTRKRRSGHELHRAGIEEGAAARLVRLAPGKEIAQWSISGDGSRIAFIVLEKPGWTVRVADVPRGSLHEILRSPRECERTCLSADGRKLAFLHDRRPAVVELDTGEAVVPRFEGSHPTDFAVLTPDGARVALMTGWFVDQNAQVLVLDLVHQVLETTSPRSVPIGPPSISADGRRALYSLEDENETQITVADLESGRLQRLSYHDGRQVNLPCLTGDGRRVLFVLYGALWATDLETGRSRRVDSREGTEVQEACASADGSRVLFKAVDLDTNRVRGLQLLDLE